MHYRQFFDGRACIKYFYGNIDKTSCCLYEQNKSNETIRRLVINRSSGPMSIDEMPIDI